MIPFKQKTNSIIKNTAVLIILLCLSDICFSFQDFRRTTEDSQRFVDEYQRQVIPNKDESRVTALQRESLEVSPYIRDVRADSRQSRIDARDIRTDFREIRTELRRTAQENRQGSRYDRKPETARYHRDSFLEDNQHRSCQPESLFRDFNNNIRNEESKEITRNNNQGNQNSRSTRQDSRKFQNYSQRRMQRQLPTRQIQNSLYESREFNPMVYNDKLIREHSREGRFRRQSNNKHRQIRNRTQRDTRKERRDFRNVRECSFTQQANSRYDDQRFERELQATRRNSPNIRITPEPLNARTQTQREVPKDAQIFGDIKERFNDRTTSRFDNRQFERQIRRNRSYYTRRSIIRDNVRRVNKEYTQERFDNVRERQNERQQKSLFDTDREIAYERPVNIRERSRGVLESPNTLTGRRTDNIRLSKELRFARYQLENSRQEDHDSRKNIRENEESTSNRRRIAKQHREPQTVLRERLEQAKTRREVSRRIQERRQDSLREKISTVADRYIDNSRISLQPVERRERYHTDNRQQSKNKREASGNLRNNREVDREREDIRIHRQNMQKREDSEPRERLMDQQRDIILDSRDAQIRNIKDTTRQNIGNSPTEVTKIEALRNIEFMPNFKEKSTVLMNTLQAVIIIALFGQIFMKTPKNRISWQAIFGKEKIF